MATPAKRKIFVVDDNTYYAELVARSLANQGYEHVSIFDSGEACLAAIDKQPELIF
jgi:PleD family two-component response regulator